MGDEDFSVRIIGFEDLTEREKEEAPDNGCGKEYANYLQVKWKGETVVFKSDAVESEDATFTRDFDWVITAIKKAYELGTSKVEEDALRYRFLRKLAIEGGTLRALAEIDNPDFITSNKEFDAVVNKAMLEDKK